MRYEDILLDKFENNDRRILPTDFLTVTEPKSLVDRLQVLINQLNTGTARLVSAEIGCKGDVYSIEVKFTIQ